MCKVYKTVVLLRGRAWSWDAVSRGILEGLAGFGWDSFLGLASDGFLPPFASPNSYSIYIGLKVLPI